MEAKPTLSQLIRECVKGLEHQEYCQLREEIYPGKAAKWAEKNQLALNCLEERFQSMIDERITQILKELRP